MNSPFSVEQARTLAARPEVRGATGNGQKVRQLYRLLFARLPDQGELASGIAFLKQGALELVPSPGAVWQYGYGGNGTFTPLSYFPDNQYRVGKAFPDPKLGYIVAFAQGGHPGNDAAHSVIRRWVAPHAMTVSVSGSLSHGQKEGDGVRGRLISSRAGVLGEWIVHNTKVTTTVRAIPVAKGESLDFVVDPMSEPSFDVHSWLPVIQAADGRESWDAASAFGPPPPASLTRLALYAQALMMTNEFLFVD
jgi:hypothetical protein